jgi:hypothetical protein
MKLATIIDPKPKTPSQIYDELQRLKGEREKFLKGRELEQLNLCEMAILYGIVSKIEGLQWSITG